MQPVPAGQLLLAVPLRLGVAVFPDDLDGDAEAHGLADAPWEVRLAAKVLREVQLGAASSWAPYLQVPSSRSKFQGVKQWQQKGWYQQSCSCMRGVTRSSAYH